MENLHVALPVWAIKRRVEVDYTIVDNLLGKELDELVQQPPTEEFYELIAKHMNAYLQDGKMPPTEIASVILNLIDDQAAGRKLTIRAGDYISLQNYLRKKK